MKDTGYLPEETNAATPGKIRTYFPFKLSALIEITLCLLYVTALSFSYAFNWMSLTHEGYGVLILLFGLLLLSWVRLDNGRHPCFLFLCVLPLFQAGRLIASAMGSSIDPYQIDFITPQPFGVSTHADAIFLLALSLSAICIYAPCRWNYRPILPEQTFPPRRGLSYLYIIFGITFPFAALENVLYLQFVNAHGGYISLFIQRAEVISSVPLLIRAMSVFMTPVFCAIFVLESRKRFLYAITASYFLLSAINLLIGSRGGTLTTLLALWYVSSIKKTARTRGRRKRSQLFQIIALGSVLIVISSVVGSFRANGADDSPFTLSAFIAGQGTTMSVSELAIQYRNRFSPYAVRYFLTEVENAFVPRDQSEYTKGQVFADDATVFLNPEAYSTGVGIGSSYLGEAYIAGAIPCVVLVSLLLGFSFNRLYQLCSTRFGLFVNVIMLPPLLWMARAGIFDWAAVFVRNAILVLVLFIGWKVYLECIRIFNIRQRTGHHPTCVHHP